MARSSTRLRGIRQQEAQRQQVGGAGLFNQMERPRGAAGLAPGTAEGITKRIKVRRTLQPLEQLAFTEGRQKIQDRIARDAFTRQMAEKQLGMQEKQQQWQRGITERQLKNQEGSTKFGQQERVATYKQRERDLKRRLAQRKAELEIKRAEHEAGAPLTRAERIAKQKQAEDIAMGRTTQPVAGTRRTTGATTRGTAGAGKAEAMPKETADAMAQALSQKYNTSGMYQPGTTEFGPQGLAFTGQLKLLQKQNPNEPPQALAEEAAILAGFPIVDPKRKAIEQEIEKLKAENLEETGGETWETRTMTWDSGPFTKRYNRIVALQRESEKLPPQDPNAAMKRLQTLRKARAERQGVLKTKQGAAQAKAEAANKAQYERIAKQYPTKPAAGAAAPVAPAPSGTLASRKPVNRSGQPVRPLPEGAEQMTMQEAAAGGRPVKFVGRQAYGLPTGEERVAEEAAAMPPPPGPPDEVLAQAQQQLPAIDAQIAEEAQWTPEGAPNPRLEELRAEKARLEGVLEQGAAQTYQQLAEEMPVAGAPAAPAAPPAAPAAALEERARRGDLAAKREAAAFDRTGISRADERKMRNKLQKELIAKHGEKRGRELAKKKMDQYRNASLATKKTFMAKGQLKGKVRQEGKDTTPAIEPMTMSKELETADPARKTELYDELLEMAGKGTVTQTNILDYLPENVLDKVVATPSAAGEAGLRQLEMSGIASRKDLPDVGFARLNRRFKLGLKMHQFEPSIVRNNLMKQEKMSKAEADKVIRKYRKYSHLPKDDILAAIKRQSTSAEHYLAPVKAKGSE